MRRRTIRRQANLAALTERLFLARRALLDGFFRGTLYRMSDEILLTNMETVPGRTIIRHIGLAQGNVVRAKHVGRDIAAGLKNIVGGELRGYTELLEEARRDALRRMSEDAKAQGANAVVNVRLSTSSVTNGASELYAYGTAVLVE